MATVAVVAMAAFAASLGHKPGCHPPIVDAAWSPLWRLSFHPVAPNVSSQGDSCGGLHVNGTWHVMTSCGGGWTHLTTTDLVHYTSHAQIKIAGGTGSVVPSVRASCTAVGACFMYCRRRRRCCYPSCCCCPCSC